ncbi:MAG: MMPL family transporter, partial [Candidatus Marinimicrobia bacterium]|nr:MMPL family transporter [Candidatus Neomarinimicrobiota bacterium]
YISFRSRRGVIFPLATVLISTLWTVGLMGWLGVQFSIVSNIMPVLLIAIGTAYGIHFLSKYSEDMAEGDDKIKGIQRALGEVGVPIVLTGVTTLIGFLSFIGSSLTAVTDFGVFTAFGVGFAMILTITFVPCALTFMEAPKKRPHRNSESAMNRIMDRLGAFVLSNEKLILWGVVLIIIVSAFGIPRLKTAVNMAEYFPEDSDMRIADKLMEDQFGGSLPIQVLFDGDLKDPAVLKEMHQFQKYLESLPDVSNSQSLANLVCEMNDILNGYYAIPESREQVANLLFLLEGDDVLDQLVNKNYTEGLIQARFRSMDTQKILEAVDSVGQYLSHEVDTMTVSVRLSEFAGAELLEAWEYLIKQSVEAIAHDATKRQPGADLDRETIQATIAAFLNKPHGQLTDQERADLMNELILYFEEESDVEIDSDELIQGTASRILGIADEDTPSRVDITALLKSVLPKLYWSDDPDVIDYTAEGIEDIVRNARRYHDVNKLSTSIMAVLPKTLQDDGKFYRDLRGDLFPTTGNIVWMPANDASSSSTSRLQARQAGMLRVINQVNTSLLNSQMTSLLIALVLVLLLMMIQFKSINMGLVVTSPIMLTVLINFAVMAYTDIPLDNATMMIASIAIGIGIDYAIHFSTRFKVELGRQENELLALDKTLETTGRAIIINALTVALGFIILVWSSIVPIQRFGALIALTMAVSAWATLTLLPALILVFKKRLPINNTASKSAIQ